MPRPTAYPAARSSYLSPGIWRLLPKVSVLSSTVKYPWLANTSVYAFGGTTHRFTDAFAWSRDADDDRNVKEIYPNGFDPHIQSAIDDNSISVGIRTMHDGWNIDLNNTYGKNKCTIM